MFSHVIRPQYRSRALDGGGPADRQPVVMAGILASVTFLLFKMVVAVIVGGSVATPFRLIGAMVLGRDALRPDFSLPATVGVALGLHLVLSLIYSVAFLAVASRIPVLRRSRLAVLLSASGMGLLLWVVNLWLVAPIFFPWFTETRPLVEVTARVLFFGLPMGLVLARTILARPEASTTTASPQSSPPLLTPSPVAATRGRR